VPGLAPPIDGFLAEWTREARQRHGYWRPDPHVMTSRG
jgi:hypothetical protein